MQRCLQIATAIALLMALPACTSQATGTTGGGASVSGSGKVCISTLQIKKQSVLSDQDIKFEMNNGDVWLNHLPSRCSGLKSQGGFAWNVHNATVCSNQEIIHVLDDGPSCAIGEFTKQPPAAT
jgi:hypothetical protein